MSDHYRHYPTIEDDEEALDERTFDEGLPVTIVPQSINAVPPMEIARDEDGMYRLPPDLLNKYRSLRRRLQILQNNILAHLEATNQRAPWPYGKDGLDGDLTPVYTAALPGQLPDGEPVEVPEQSGVADEET